MWHFIPNPLSLGESLVTLNYVGAGDGYGEIQFTSWVLPDASIMEHAPTEYIMYVNVGYRESNTTNWAYFNKNIRYNSEMRESPNVLIFMSSRASNGKYVTAHMVGSLSVEPNFTDKKWEVYMDGVMAYLPSGAGEYPKNSTIFEANQVAMQGINIYY